MPGRKRLPLGLVSVFAIVFGFTGYMMLFGGRAATPVAFGTQFHCMWSSYTDAERTALLDKMAAAKVGWVRIDVGWDGLESSRDVYSGWYTNRTDFCVNEANKRGLKVLITLHRTPGWANSNAGTSVPPTNLSDFADFAGWAARYFKGRVAAWEVWNEPDPSQSFWTGTVDQYVSMLKLAYPKFKAGDPGAKVVLGGCTYNNDAWIGQVYSLGAKDSFDVLATHPYQGKANQPPEYAGDSHVWWFTHFPAVLNVMNKYGDGAKEVWFTEFGWSSHANTSSTPDWQLGVTEQEQGDYLVRAIKYTEANYPNVTNMFWYNERNRTNTDIQNSNYGLLYSDLSEKPAYATLKNFLANRLAVDTSAPAVSLTNPANGATVSGSVSVSASASDNVGVARVEFYLNGNLLTTDTTAPYDVGWDTTKVVNGAATLSALAYDTSGNQASSALVNVTVNNSVVPADTTAPSATVTNPADGVNIGNKLTVGASAKDNVGVTKMELYFDGQLFATSNSTTISASKNTRKAARGAHTVTVRAYDAAGNVGTQSITIYK